MPDNDTCDRVSRRTVLRTSALASTCSILGGLSVGTATAATQEGETLLELFAGESSLVVARGDALGLGDEAIPGTNWLPDARIRGPEGILAFAPRRLAEQADGRVRLDHLLVMTSVQAIEGDLTAGLNGALVPGSDWFPGSEWVPGDAWFPTDIFMPADGFETTLVFAVPGSEWVPGDAWFPGSKWFPGSEWEPGRPPWWSGESVERGTSLNDVAQEGGVLVGAAGPTFFPDGLFDERRVGSWEELAQAETATVIEPDDLQA